jgi:hypothetical protein
VVVSFKALKNRRRTIILAASNEKGKLKQVHFISGTFIKEPDGAI